MPLREIMLGRHGRPASRCGCWIRLRPGTSATCCSARRRPRTPRHGRIAFKTGTTYGYRDAWAVGFDGRITIGVWVGRPDGAPVPGLVGRTAAAPILFDAFARTGKVCRRGCQSRRKGVLVACNAKLPPPLRRFRPLGWTSPQWLRPGAAHQVPAEWLAHRSRSIRERSAMRPRCRSRSPAGRCRMTVLVNGVSAGDIDGRAPAPYRAARAGFRAADRDRCHRRRGYRCDPRAMMARESGRYGRKARLSRCGFIVCETHGGLASTPALWSRATVCKTCAIRAAGSFMAFEFATASHCVRSCS